MNEVNPSAEVKLSKSKKKRLRKQKLVDSIRRAKLKSAEGHREETEKRVIRAYFFQRTDSCEHSVLQVPDLMRKLEERSIMTRRSGMKTRKIKQQAQLRGEEVAESCKLHSVTLFRQREVVEYLGRVTPKDELLHSVDRAAALEMMYTLAEGINHLSLPEGQVYMTLKQLFLFSFRPDQTLSVDQRTARWSKIVPHAVRSGAGILVQDVLDKGLVSTAVEWLRGCIRDEPLPPNPSYIMPPVFFDNVKSGGDEPPDTGGANWEWGAGSEDGGEEGGCTVDTGGPGQIDGGGVRGWDESDRVNNLLKALQGCSSHEAVMCVAYDSFRNRSPRTIPVTTTGDVPAPVVMAYDEDAVLECVRILGVRWVGQRYRNDVKGLWTAPDMPDGPVVYGGSDDAEQQEARRYSVEKNVDELVRRSIARGKTPEQVQHLQHLREFGFFVGRCMSPWYLCLVELLVGVESRKFLKLFLKEADAYWDRWDKMRHMSRVDKKDPLFKVISGPVTEMMRELGLLDVLGEDVSREVGACSVLRSLAREQNTPVLQGMHVDTNPYFDWGDKFGFSTITAGCEPAALDIYPGSFAGRRGTRGVPVRVELNPGETIVFNGLARHRGTSYTSRNLRFFTSFVVKEAVDAASDEDYETTDALEKLVNPVPDPPAITFEQWRKLGV